MSSDNINGFMSESVCLRQVVSTGDIRNLPESRTHPISMSLSQVQSGSNLSPDVQIDTISSMLSIRPENGPAPTTDLGAARRRRTNFSPTALFKKVYTFLGYGPNNTARKDLVSMIWSVTLGFVQVVIVIVFVAYSALHISPTKAPLKEWQACDRPLGAWNCVWIFRALFGCSMSFWGWRRDYKNRSTTSTTRRVSVITNDIESGSQQPINQLSTSNDRRSTTVNDTTNSNSIERPNVSRHSRLYARLSLLLSLLSMAWFLIAHIFIYTSLQTCRFSSPHLWWLSFGIVCILYLMVLEVICIALMVFVVCPIAFLLWNILLLCLGRHPLQNSHHTKPEGKSSKSVVDRLPLVLYIPPPPDEIEKDSVSVPTPIYNPKKGHTYPPKSSGSPKRRHLFKFLRIKSKKKTQEMDEKAFTNDTMDEATPWEDNWESGEYPFVRLEGNRAICAICLMDFEEPTKSRNCNSIVNTANAVPEVSSDEKRPVQNNEEIVRIEADDELHPQLHLEDPGEGAQPLRLLPCGHVFHKTCIDPWLIDVSGRCPTCQRPIEPKRNKKAKRSSN